MFDYKSLLLRRHRTIALLALLAVIFLISLPLLAQNAVDFTTVADSGMVASLKKLSITALITIFAIMLMVNLFKIIVGREPYNILYMTVAKFGILYILLIHSGATVSYLSSNIASLVSGQTDTIEVLSKSFVRLDGALTTLLVGDLESLDKAKKEGLLNAVLPESVSESILAMSQILNPQFWMNIIYSGIIKLAMLLSFVLKYIMLDTMYPILYQLTLIGILFAVPVSMTEQGLGALKAFSLAAIEIGLWPFFYYLGIGVTVNMTAKNIESFAAAIPTVRISTTNAADTAFSTAQSVNNFFGVNFLLTVSLIASLFWLCMLPILTPAISRLVVRHEGSASLFGAVTGAITSVAAKVGSKMMK